MNARACWARCNCVDVDTQLPHFCAWSLLLIMCGVAIKYPTIVYAADIVNAGCMTVSLVRAEELREMAGHAKSEVRFRNPDGVDGEQH